MNTGGPYLNAGLICEKVLQERDGVLSIIRAIDRITIAAMSAGTPAPETMPPSNVALTLVLILKSGLFKGTAAVRLGIYSPSGQAMGESSTDVFFEGDDRGINLVSPMQMQVEEDGLYWVEVSCGDQLLTRIPFRVIYQRITQGSLQLRPDEPSGPR